MRTAPENNFRGDEAIQGEDAIREDDAIRVDDAAKPVSRKKMSRRSFAIGSFGSIALLGLGALKYLPAQSLTRPPGAQDEDHLITACIHCEKCIEICPKSALTLSHIEDGLLNARTPKMDFRRGWCDFCEQEPDGPKCVAVCPTNAFSVREGISPQNTVIGKAVLKREWCLAAKGMGCDDCVVACPYEAMSLGYDNVPVVDTEACNGCGACENACISLSAGSITVGATDRAITVVTGEEAARLGGVVL